MFLPESRTRRRRGFTLIELLVVMAIIATLASMVSAAIFRAIELSKQTSSINNLGNNIGVAMLMYADSHGVMPSENVKQVSGKAAGQMGSFYTAILDYVDEQTNDPSNPRPVALFVNPSRRQVQANGTAWRDYGYVGSQALQGKSSVLGSQQSGVSTVQITNGSGMSKTFLLSTLWMNPEQYNTDTKTWADFPNAASKAENVPDKDQGGDGAIGAPHPGANPHLFCDRHISKVPYRWDPQSYYLLWTWNNTTQHVTPP